MRFLTVSWSLHRAAHSPRFRRHDSWNSTGSAWFQAQFHRSHIVSFAKRSLFSQWHVWSTKTPQRVPVFWVSEPQKDANQRLPVFISLSKQCRFRNRSEGDSPNFRKKTSSHRPFLWLCNYHQWFMTLGRPPLPCQAARTAWNRSPIWYPTW